ncbi:MAG TPA: glycerophosphodiester phosphodiesterase [Nevskiaceae bacterium]|nr:glycerophosphodiester phosphodiesterase [Nevskiaceae bacterium]
MDAFWSRHRYWIIGHRGARGHAPENTLAGIDAGLRLGADMIEIDVQYHADELWLLHDLRLERTTSGRGRLADARRAELEALQVSGEPLPSLDAAIRRIDGRVPLNIELKSAGGSAEAVARCLRAHLQQGARPADFLVSSFHLPELARFRAALPEVPVGALFCGVPLDYAAAAATLGAASVNLGADFLEPALLEDARRRGLALLVYTVNEPEELVRLREAGITGVFTDYPDRGRTAAGG